MFNSVLSKPMGEVMRQRCEVRSTWSNCAQGPKWRYNGRCPSITGMFSGAWMGSYYLTMVWSHINYIGSKRSVISHMPAHFHFTSVNSSVYHSLIDTQYNGIQYDAIGIQHKIHKGIKSFRLSTLQQYPMSIFFFSNHMYAWSHKKNPNSICSTLYTNYPFVLALCQINLL